jgi:hypothetical protein
MSTKTLPQYARIEVPFGIAFDFCHCPVCGQASAKADNDELTINPCAHLEFLFICEVGEFEHQSDDFKRRLKEGKTDLDELSFETFPHVLEKMGYGNDLIAMEVTHGGMACGPVWSTQIYGYRFGNIN